MSTKKYELAVYIGRFQPFHIGHEKVIQDGLEIADKVLVLVGSSNTSRSVKNPFSFFERERMIYNVFNNDERIIVEPLEDYTYNENLWLEAVQNKAYEYSVSDDDVVLLGYKRDHSSYYLNAFPMWDTYFSDEHFHFNEPINGTQLRNEYFASPGAFFKGHYADMLPEKVQDFLKEYASIEKFKIMREEWEYIASYKKAWENSPYPPVFVTVDAVVVQSGHVLLIKRKYAPGKGLLAIPGGFIGQSEKIFDACIRELREETKLKVPEKVLRGSNTYTKVFDAPDRSQRGRTITHAFLFELDNSEPLPRVRGSDDAEFARWYSFAEIERMPDEFFEDHYHIVKHMIARSK